MRLTDVTSDQKTLQI